MAVAHTQSENTIDSMIIPSNNRAVSYTHLPGLSRLFLDSVGGSLPGPFQFNFSRREIVAGLQKRVYPREELSQILHAQAIHYDADQQSRDAIVKIRDPRSVVVIAGQQAGWYGGAILSLVKAFVVAKSARVWSDDLGVPIVPIFWIAADDHDLDEIRSTTFLNRSGQLVAVEYPNDHKSLSAGDTPLNDQTALEASLAVLQSALGEGEFTSSTLQSVSDSYRAGETFATAFGRLMAKLTAGTGLVLFSPSDKEVKRLARPWFSDVVDKQVQLSAAFQERSAALLHHGYHAQIEKKPAVAFLFHHSPARQSIIRAGENWKSESQTWTTSTLLNEIERSSESFSPNAIARPLLQSWLFPVIAQFGGPSEIAYLHQVAPLFELMGLARPQHLARPGVTFVDKRTSELMSSANLTFESLLASDPEKVIANILASSFPESLQKELDAVRQEIRERAAKLSPLGGTLDPQLAELANQTAGKIDYLVGQFAEKLQQNHRKREKETRERWTKTFALLAPNRGLQERSINVLSFLARYGPDVPKWIYEAIDPDSPDHRILSI